jgi:hypothetical protein
MLKAVLQTALNYRYFYSNGCQYDLKCVRLVSNFVKNHRKSQLSEPKILPTFLHFFTSQVAHEVLALEILTLLLENPTGDSAEVAITFLKEVRKYISCLIFWRESSTLLHMIGRFLSLPLIG